jgi:hypothetical protein
LGTLEWRFEDPEPKVADVLVEQMGENAVTVKQQETVTMVSRDGFTQLMQRPVRCRVCRYIAMHNTAGRVFHQENQTAFCASTGCALLNALTRGWPALEATGRTPPGQGPGDGGAAQRTALPEGTPYETSVDFLAVERVSCTPTIITCTEGL